jgi:hypothetical protein
MSPGATYMTNLKTQGLRPAGAIPRALVAEMKPLERRLLVEPTQRTGHWPLPVTTRAVRQKAPRRSPLPLLSLEHALGRSVELNDVHLALATCSSSARSRNASP